MHSSSMLKWSICSAGVAIGGKQGNQSETKIIYHIRVGLRVRVWSLHEVVYSADNWSHSFRRIQAMAVLSHLERLVLSTSFLLVVQDKNILTFEILSGNIWSSRSSESDSERWKTAKIHITHKTICFTALPDLNYIFFLIIYCLKLCLYVSYPAHIKIKLTLGFQTFF
jgi:hypothetical protein